MRGNVALRMTEGIFLPLTCTDIRSSDINVDERRLVVTFPSAVAWPAVAASLELSAGDF